jgi:predicted nucleic acid-binding protein
MDAEAMSALAGRSSPRQREVRAALSAALRLDRDVIVPAVVLAELYRTSRRNALVDACLSREVGLGVRSTDRPLARLVGSILAAA